MISTFIDTVNMKTKNNEQLTQPKSHLGIRLRLLQKR